MLTTSDHEAVVVDELSRRYPHQPRATIEHWVAEGFESYSAAPVQTYVPVLVERQVADRLRRSASAN